MIRLIRQILADYENLVKTRSHLWLTEADRPKVMIMGTEYELEDIVEGLKLGMENRDQVIELQRKISEVRLLLA